MPTKKKKLENLWFCVVFYTTGYIIRVYRKRIFVNCDMINILSNLNKVQLVFCKVKWNLMLEKFDFLLNPFKCI